MDQKIVLVYQGWFVQSSQLSSSWDREGSLHVELLPPAFRKKKESQSVLLAPALFSRALDQNIMPNQCVLGVIVSEPLHTLLTLFAQDHSLQRHTPSPGCGL